MTNPTKLTEILRKSQDDLELPDWWIEETTATIEAWIDGAIGEDESIEPDYYEFTPEELTRNQLRADIRHSLGIQTKKEA